MKKAKFIRKYYGKGYDKDFVYMDYEYKGYEYTVYENLAKGNEPLSWQHRSEQARIDSLIELENKPKTKKTYRYEDTAEYAFNEFWKCIEGKSSIFD